MPRTGPAVVLANYAGRCECMQYMFSRESGVEDYRSLLYCKYKNHVDWSNNFNCNYELSGLVHSEASRQELCGDNAIELLIKYRL